MPLPAVYTEGLLLGFMETEVGATGEALGLLTTDALSEAVNDVIGILGHSLSEETTTAGLIKVRAIAAWRAWRAAKAAATGEFDLKAGSTSLTRSQTFKHVNEMYLDAESAAMVYDEVAAVLAGGNSALVTGLGTIGSPYSWSDEWA